MAGLDTAAILDLTATLARNLAATYTQRFGLPWVDPAVEQQFGPTVAPGLVAFIARLSAALPPDFDLDPILRRFCADPAVAAALLAERPGPETAQALADAFLAAGMDAGLLDRTVFDEALAAFSAAAGEMGRRLGATYDQHAQARQLYHVQRPSDDNTLRRTIAALVDALAAQGLARVDAGQVIASDGYTILFTWGDTTAGQQMAESSPPEETLRETVEPGSMGGGLESLGESEVDLPVAPPLSGQPLPAPPPPPPAPVPPVVALRLDAAAPPQVVVGHLFDLAVAIRRPDSPAFAPADLTQRESAGFDVVWPQGVAYLTMRIQISAPGCDIHGGDSRQVRLLPGADGPPVYFQLTPRQPGPLSLIVTVYQETDWIGSARLLTEVGGVKDEGAGSPVAGAARAGVVLTVASAPLGNTEVNHMTLRHALDKGYNESELRELCFELEIEYEDLSGDNQSAKARELVLYAKRRGLLATLVKCVMRDRSYLLVTN